MTLEQFLSSWHEQANEYGGSLTDDQCDIATEAWEAATEDAQAKSGWRPIETAPKDGTVIDIWRSGCGGYRTVNMLRADLGNENVFYEPETSGPSCVRDATHWMPLPEGPK